MSTTRLCIRCNIEKDVSSFPIDSRNTTWINRICKQCNQKRAKENRPKYLEYYRKYNWKKRYGEDFDVEGAYRYFTEISLCQICGKQTNLHLDHNHKTGKLRGLLCGSCNRALGLFQDNPEVLRKAADYVQVDKHGKYVYH